MEKSLRWHQKAKRDSPFAIVVVFFALAVFLSWRRWCDPLIDFGREVYLAWQISQGEVLYRDLAHLFGPLSAHINGFLFWIFTPSLTVLTLFNLLLLLVFSFLIYRFFTFLFYRRTGVVAALVFLLLSGFNHIVLAGNYNFVWPYTHSALHGTYLSLLFLFSLVAYYRFPGELKAFWPGLWLGLVMLAKVELFFAASLTLLVSFFLIWAQKEERKRFHFKSLRWTALGFILPLLLSCLYFWGVCQFSFMNSLQATGSAFLPLIRREGVIDEFYLMITGFDEPWQNAFILLFSYLVVLVLLAFTFAVDYCWRDRETLARRVGAVGGVGVILLGALLFEEYLIIYFTRPLPLVLATIILYLSYRYFSKNEEDKGRIFALLMWSLWGLFLLPKIVLSVTFYHYGFYLTTFGFILWMVFFLYYLPHLCEEIYGGGCFFRWIWGVIFFFCLFFCLKISADRYWHKTIPIGHGQDRFYGYSKADKRLPLIKEALSFLEKRSSRGETLAVVPEGALLNYLSRRPNSQPYFVFMPLEMRCFGEENIRESFRRHPPDWIVLWERRMKEYGAEYFGKNERFGALLTKWIGRHYRPVKKVGKVPFEKEGLGLIIYKKKQE